MKIVNRVGLEVEFFVLKNNLLVYPDKYGFCSDDFIIIGEFRCDPGKTREETIANFYKEFTKVRRIAKEKGVDLTYGYREITPQFRAEVLKKMGNKEIADTRNIYDTNILELSDDVIVDGKITSCKISTGLHVHFSRHVECESKIYEGRKHDRERIVTDKLSIITPSQRKSIIRGMDVRVLPTYNLGVQLKYRNQGFYEEKPWGFEYRSLPSCDKILELFELENVVDHAFLFLEQLAN
jgi:hypothetical protein